MECAFGLSSNEWRILHRAINNSKQISNGTVKVCVVSGKNGKRNEDVSEGH